MKKQLLLLLLLVILGNVAYWSLNKKFLHDELIAMVTGKSNTPALELEPEPQPQVVTETETIQAATNDTAQTISADSLDNSEPDQLNTMIDALQDEINGLQQQTFEINRSIEELSTETERVNRKIEEIGANYQLSPEQLEEILLENTAAQATPSEVTAEQPATSQ